MLRKTRKSYTSNETQYKYQSGKKQPFIVNIRFISGDRGKIYIIFFMCCFVFEFEILMREFLHGKKVWETFLIVEIRDGECNSYFDIKNSIESFINLFIVSNIV